ncbi:hypothetical protein SPHN_01905 [Sphingomonas faeni]|nr:hypothetical protein [Sphingomonas faeni]
MSLDARLKKRGRRIGITVCNRGMRGGPRSPYAGVVRSSCDPRQSVCVRPGDPDDGYVFAPPHARIRSTRQGMTRDCIASFPTTPKARYSRVTEPKKLCRPSYAHITQMIFCFPDDTHGPHVLDSANTKQRAADTV